MTTIGVFDWLDAHHALRPAALYASRLGLLQRAEALGFDIYHLAEHHGTPLGLVGSPHLFLAAATQCTQRIRLCPTVHVLPLHHPLRLAEETAMLDQMSGGRMEVGVGKGASPYESRYFGVDKDSTTTLFEQRLALLRTALESGRMDLPEVAGGWEARLPVQPLQRPHPPLWYPTINGSTIPRLAVEGFNTVFSFGFLTPPIEEIRARCEQFLELAAGRSWEGISGADADGPRFGLLRHVFVAGTDEEARESALPALRAHYESFIDLWREHGDDRHPPERDFSRLMDEGKVIVGSPSTVREHVMNLLTQTGANHFVGAFAFGSLPVEAAECSLELFAAEVMPTVRGTATAFS